MKFTIDQETLWTQLDTLASFSDVPAPAVTRVVYSPVDLQARDYVKSLCAEAGLSIREDAIGNTFARWKGSEPGLSPVGTGSHIDAIPNAGRFDGTVGVLGGLQAIVALQRSGFCPRRSVELLLFTSEEPTRFGIGCLGSRMLSGTLSPSTAQQFTDREGLDLNELRRNAGFPGSLESVALPTGYYSAFLELHIEQGPLLERQQIPLGIVTAIAAPASQRITITGQGGHAGAVLMPDRHDAFLAAAEIALALERAVKSTGAIDSVGTVGVCDVFPGAVNSIPNRVQLETDVRDTVASRRDTVLAEFATACEEIGARRSVSIQTETRNADDPAHCDQRIVEVLQTVCRSQGHAFLPMVSRAYHDSLFMSRIAPVAMLFIPCRNGHSHRPDEYASPEDIARGTEVLAMALAELAG